MTGRSGKFLADVINFSGSDQFCCRTTIPDGMRENGQTVEAKAGSSVSDSKQLRLQSDISQQSGQKAQMILKSGTKVSKTVQERMNVKEQK